jgi:hypothetical protein
LVIVFLVVTVERILSSGVPSNGDLDAVLYLGEARMGARSSEGMRYVHLSGVSKLEVRRGVVDIGTTTGIVGLLAAGMGLRYRLEASRFEVLPRPVPGACQLVLAHGDGVVLRGETRRGTSRDFVILPRDGDAHRLIGALERAGARVDSFNQQCDA